MVAGTFTACGEVIRKSCAAGVPREREFTKL
jgi:hypothetical protein